MIRSTNLPLSVEMQTALSVSVPVNVADNLSRPLYSFLLHPTIPHSLPLFLPRHGNLRTSLTRSGHIHKFPCPHPRELNAHLKDDENTQKVMYSWKKIVYTSYIGKVRYIVQLLSGASNTLPQDKVLQIHSHGPQSQTRIRLQW